MLLFFLFHQKKDNFIFYCFYNIQIINFDDYASENKTEHNLKWPYIPDHPWKILIIGGSGSGETNALLNLINTRY